MKCIIKVEGRRYRCEVCNFLLRWLFVFELFFGEIIGIRELIESLGCSGVRALRRYKRGVGLEESICFISCCFGRLVIVCFLFLYKFYVSFYFFLVIVGGKE